MLLYSAYRAALDLALFFIVATLVYALAQRRAEREFVPALHAARLDPSVALRQE